VKKRVATGLEKKQKKSPPIRKAFKSIFEKD